MKKLLVLAFALVLPMLVSAAAQDTMKQDNENLFVVRNFKELSPERYALHLTVCQESTRGMNL